MQVPKKIRKQIKEYEAAGFHVIDWEPAAGSHFKVNFAEFPERMVLTASTLEPRAIKNNIAMFKRMARQLENT
jgi:hypothetical protein